MGQVKVTIARSVSKPRLALVVFFTSLAMATWYSSSWVALTELPSALFTIRMELAEDDYLSSVGKSRDEFYRESFNRCLASSANPQQPLNGAGTLRGVFVLDPDPSQICNFKPLIALPSEDMRSYAIGLGRLCAYIAGTIYFDLLIASLAAVGLVFAIPSVSVFLVNFIAPRNSK